MTLITERLNNLVQGVSQQPASLRLSSQAEAQENCLSDISAGLRTRPPFQHVAKLNSNAPGNRFVHQYNRDTAERYVVIAQSGSLNVYDMITGAAKTVNLVGPDWNYLNASDAKTAFRMISVGDTTFIVNTEVTTAMSGSPAASQIPTAIVSIKTGDYDTLYEIEVDGTKYNFKSHASARQNIQTGVLMSELMKVVKAGLDATFTISKNGTYTDPVDLNEDSGNAMKLVRQNSADFTINGNDGLGDTALVVVKESVRRFVDLPKTGFDGFVCRVDGDETNDYDDHWVKFNEAKGHWEETVKYGLDNSFNAATMPHKLVRNSDGTFSFGPIAWGSRVVGDLESAPNPSFVGKKINNVFFFANRLGFLAGENAIMSETGEYFNFYPRTVTTLLDTAPIDVAASGPKIALLKHAKQHQGKLLLFSDTTQLSLFAQDDVITAKTVEIKTLTDYETLVTVPPVVSGELMYFAENRGAYAGLLEYAVKNFDDSEVAATSVSEHVQRYIDSSIFHAAESSSENAVVYLSRTNPNRMYVYKYYLSGGEKVQSSWSVWTVEAGAAVLGAGWINADLYVTVQRADGIYVEKASQREGADLELLGFDAKLDRKCRLTGVYNAGTGLTTWTLPYADSSVVGLLGGEWGTLSGTLLTLARPTTTTATTSGDYSAHVVTFGKVFLSRYEFSEMFARESRSGSNKTITEGRLQLRKMSLEFANSGAFKVRVHSRGRIASEYIYSGFVLGTGVLGEQSLTKGRFEFPLLGHSRDIRVEIESISHIPASFQSASFEGKYWKRSSGTSGSQTIR